MYLENFKKLRKAKGLTLKNIADQLGVTVPYVRKWEIEKVIPDKFSDTVCNLLGIPIEEQEFYCPDCIINFRKSLDMNPTDFSILLEVSPSTLTRWESGRMEVSPKSTIRLHNLYKKINSDLKSPKEEE